MRAGKAYIASAGTTGVLVAGAILLLVVVGALMAFDGDERPDALPPVESVLLGPVQDVEVPATAADARTRPVPDDVGPAARVGRAPERAAVRTESRRGAGDLAEPSPVVPDLDEPPGEGSGDAQGPPAATAPAPGTASEPSDAPDPLSQVGDAVNEVIRDVSEVLPRQKENEAVEPDAIVVASAVP